jgi:uncharacterized protein YjbI with pentapeptide repeats
LDIHHCGLLVGALYWYPEAWAARGFVEAYYANVSTSILSISATVLLIDRLNEKRGQREEKQRLIREMGAGDSATALRAVKEIRARGWLTDGSLVGADLSGANLDDAQLERSNLSRADLFRTKLGRAELPHALLGEAVLRGVAAENCNMKGVDLRGANLRKAGLSGAILEDAFIDSRCELLGAQFRRRRYAERQGRRGIL